MCRKYEGDVFCQSVMSHHSKCISSGTASLALSMYIHHINATRRKRPICVSDSFVGPQGVCVCVCLHTYTVCTDRKRYSVGNRRENKQQQKKKARERVISQGLEEFSVIYICRFWSP